MYHSINKCTIVTLDIGRVDGRGKELSVLAAQFSYKLKLWEWRNGSVVKSTHASQVHVAQIHVNKYKSPKTALKVKSKHLKTNPISVYDNGAKTAINRFYYSLPDLSPVTGSRSVYM